MCRGNAIALALIRRGHPVHAVIILPSVQPFKDEAQTAEFKDLDLPRSTHFSTRL